MRPKALLGFVLWGVALGVLAIDQATKYLVRTYMALGEGIVLIPILGGLVSLVHIRNAGAAFGLFPGAGTFFILVAVVVVIAIVFYQRRLEGDGVLLRLALGLQLGGAVGNLIDRLRFGGYVTDFIYVRYWATSNLADVCIVTGIILLGWQYWRDSASGKGQE